MTISKAVLITGCSTGIGRATAEELVSAGFPVWATARRLSDIEELKGLGCRTLALDVTDEESMRAAVAAVEAEHGAVGVLINNAGYSQSGALETLPMAKVRKQFETNVFGLLRLTQMVLPGMRRQGWGRVVNLSSMGGKLVFPGGGAYHATKHAVEALSDALRMEVKEFGVDVVVIEPGLIRTHFARTVAEQMPRVDPSDPYGEFNAQVARNSVHGYEGAFARMFGGNGAAVARVIRKAVEAKRPGTRYPVTSSARILLTLRRLLPDRWWDGMVKGVMG